MQRRGVTFGLVPLLSTTVLLGGMIPPATQHAHFDGEQPHHHRIGTVEQHAHEHDHAHRHPQDRRDERVMLRGETRHLHVALFGFDFWLPIREHDRGPQKNRNPDEQLPTTLVRIVDDEVVVAPAPTGAQPDVGLPYPAIAVSRPPIRPGGQGERDALSSLPLCDSARGERSGVQLI